MPTSTWRGFWWCLEGQQALHESVGSCSLRTAQDSWLLSTAKRPTAPSELFPSELSMCPGAVKVAELRSTSRAQGSGRGARRQRKALVAVKHMKQNEMSSFEDCAEFDDECALLRKLRHRCTTPRNSRPASMHLHMHDSLLALRTCSWEEQHGSCSFQQSLPIRPGPSDQTSQVCGLLRLGYFCLVLPCKRQPLSGGMCRLDRGHFCPVPAGTLPGTSGTARGVSQRRTLWPPWEPA